MRMVTLFLVFGWDASLALHAMGQTGDDAPIAVATFHCLGVYWSPSGGSADREVLVRYRRQGASSWKEGLPMRYNPIAGTDEELADYRGSIVNLEPGTVYEVRLALAGTSTRGSLSVQTWMERPPVGKIVRVGDRNTPLTIDYPGSGKPNAWVVYDGRDATIDVRHQHDQCIIVNASYVAIRGFTLKGAGMNAAPRRPRGAIQIDGGRDILIEDCDISGWGGQNAGTGFGYAHDSAILSRSQSLQHLIVQRCKMHHPATDTNSWYEPKYPTHPDGPQCITLVNTAGNHVIRYNECYSDLEHMFNDAIGGWTNSSYLGAPGRDSDIYGNLVSHCWDDGIEVEGGGRNVRVWGNYITQAAVMIGNAPVAIGPLYVWRNVVGRCQFQPDAAGASFLKMGHAGNEAMMTGYTYIFHNTIFPEDGWLPTGGIGGSHVAGENRIAKHAISRNNIFQVRSAEWFSASDHNHNTDTDVDYDLFSGRVPKDQEAHGVRGEPVYAPGAGFDAASKTGRFQLASGSPGEGAGAVIPNFTDDYAGSAPDIGAHQRNTPPMRFGVKAAASVSKSGPAR